MAESSQSHWPVLTRYDGSSLARVALPIGGIGTGTISLGGRGDLHDWEVGNRPAKGFTPRHSFFALWTRQAGGEPVVRALEGPIEPALYEGYQGAVAANHGLPRFRGCSFEAAYPFGQVALSDPDVPVEARLQAFNPLIPADADRSGIPVAVLRWTLTNRTDTEVEASVCASVQNFIGTDGLNGAANRNLNEFRRSPNLAGVHMSTEGTPPDSEFFGTLALATTHPDVSHRIGGRTLAGRLAARLLGRLQRRRRLDERDAAGVDAPVASLAVSVVLPPRGSATVSFFIGWHFPNRRAWGRDEAQGSWGYSHERVGNHYATQYADAWDVVERTARDLPQLEANTLRFVESFCASDLPPVVKEAALYNLSTLRTQTCFRTEDGRFYGWEGCEDRVGSCLGSCTHVWNYEQATAFLFGDLARSMREVEFAHATRDDGHMSFRVQLPLNRATEWGLAAADGQMGCIMKLYREWRLSGDDAFLRELWPRARKALEFCWIPGGWDADRDGVMEAVSTTRWTLSTRAEPADGSVVPRPPRRRGHSRLPGRYGLRSDVSRPVRAWRRVGGRPPVQRRVLRAARPTARRPLDDMPASATRTGARDLSDPDLQIGPGCLVDQLVRAVHGTRVRPGLSGEPRARERDARQHPDVQLQGAAGRPLQPPAHLRARRRGRARDVLIPEASRPRRPFPTSTR
ncbi:MAG: GH116 family glycosyl-hydrolase [Chloroflexia bacterium]